MIVLNGNYLINEGGEMDLTLSIIKPDAVKRNITGEINSIIEKIYIKIVAQKIIHI